MSPSRPLPAHKKRLRIVEFTRIHTLHGHIGGMQRHSHNLCSSWTAQGHEVHVVTTPRRRTSRKDLVNVPFDLGSGGKGRYPAHLTSKLPAGRWTPEFHQAALGLIRDLQPDVVHCESASYGAGGIEFYRALAQAGIPIVTTFHSCTWDRMRMYLRLMRCPDVHPEIQEEIRKFSKKLTRLQEMHLEEVEICNASDRVVALSELFYREFRNNYFQPSTRLRRIYLGVDLTQFAPLPGRSSTPGGQLRLLFVGRFRWDKGIDTAFRALRLLRQRGTSVQLDFVCAGEATGVRELAVKLGVDDMIRWHFDVEHEKVASFYQRADVFLNPTYRYTGLDFTTLEAMACGCIVVASDIGDMFEDWFAPTLDRVPAHAGLLAGYHDPEAIADAVVGLQALPDVEIQRVRANARALAERHFDVRQIARQYLELFHEVCA